MTKFGLIDFDDRILEALRNDKLVIFAGAGVSMGSPSLLPSFEKLAEGIALGSGLKVDPQIDKFLGQLSHSGINIYERANKILSKPGSSPTSLHHDLIKIFRTVEQIRLVTTNFDLHFESASKDLFGSVPDVYIGPALPLGKKFKGIVHIHGAISRYNEIVLSDSDFGKAYLTEGWARRFLVDLFQNYSVLFVGYSHKDIVMNYLSRALPISNSTDRFALTDEDGNWDFLGINPIIFNIVSGPNPFIELYDSIHQLAERATRGALDWKSRMTIIGSGDPPVDEITIGEVEQGLREAFITRFFTDAARDITWLDWLDSRNLLDALFGSDILSERDILFANWLASNYVIEHPDAVISLLSKHKMQINSQLWETICREFIKTKREKFEELTLNKWIPVLLSCAPNQASHHTYVWLAECSADQNRIDLTLMIFLEMCKYSLQIVPGLVWHDKSGTLLGRPFEAKCNILADEWSLNIVWSKYLKTHISKIAQPLLSGIIHIFESIHSSFVAWNSATKEWDSISYHRSAIEINDQNMHMESTDVLVDAVRDTIEWLADHSLELFGSWVEILGASDVPILRRLAVHSIMFHPHLTADERLKWLIDRFNIHGFSEHHEIYKAMAYLYPIVSEEMRKNLVGRILEYKLPGIREFDSEFRTSREHFEWLSWLAQSKPDCRYLEEALAPIKSAYPQWVLSEHPDFTHWIGDVTTIIPESPWTIEQLLSKEPYDQLDDLLSFEENPFTSLNRDGLISTVKEACSKQPRWAFSLANALVEKVLWVSDLWPAIFRGWQDANLSVEDWKDVLRIVQDVNLYDEYSFEIVNMLNSLVKDEGNPFVLDILDEANKVAMSIWKNEKTDIQDEIIIDWLFYAINSSAGNVVDFWLHGLSLLLRNKTGVERSLPDNYRQWFSEVVLDLDTKGGLGRCILCRQTSFLFSLDEIWTKQFILPLFSDPDQKKFCQAWDGLLFGVRFYPSLVNELIPSFKDAIARLEKDYPKHRQRFIEAFTVLVVYHVDNPYELLKSLLLHGSAEDKNEFASRVGFLLRHMEPKTKQNLWNRWLKQYWEDRLQSIPTILNLEEIVKMLEWLPHLGDLYVEAVPLATRFPQIRLGNSFMLFELRESDLVLRYPVETANLLIYICRCEIGYHANDIDAVNKKLPMIDIKLRHELDEALARVGAFAI